MPSILYLIIMVIKLICIISINSNLLINLDKFTHGLMDECFKLVCKSERGVWCILI
jgi:hypothetical protein